MWRMSMVPFSSLVDVYSNSHFMNNRQAMEELENAFEYGMTEVLKELAYMELLKYENKNEDNLNHTKEDKKVTEALNRASNLCDNNEQKSALLDVEAVINGRAAIESEKYFINGFILGYKYLKTLKK